MVRWTAKLPTLLVGVTLWIIAALVAHKGARWVAVVLVLLGGAFVGYSLTIKDWCKPVAVMGQTAWGSGAWSGSFGDCWRKSWIEF